MTGWLQAAASVSVAFGLHIGFFALPSANVDLSAEDASGEAGTESVSLAAQDATIAALVADWDRPPALPDLVADMPAPTEPSAPMMQPALPDMPSLPDAPQMAVLAPVLDAAPTPEPAPKAPEVAPKPKPKAKPVKAAPKKAEKKPAAESRAGQKAVGDGGGLAEGKGGKAEVAGVSKAKTTELKAAWGGKVRARIERKKSYPKAANGASGTVSVRLTVGNGGDLQGVSVAGSSGNASLDAAALKAVKSAGKFPKAPKGLTEASYSFTLSMSFQN